jgi:hypothetical protein
LPGRGTELPGSGRAGPPSGAFEAVVAVKSSLDPTATATAMARNSVKQAVINHG